MLYLTIFCTLSLAFVMQVKMNRVSVMAFFSTYAYHCFHFYCLVGYKDLYNCMLPVFSLMVVVLACSWASLLSKMYIMLVQFG